MSKIISLKAFKSKIAGATRQAGYVVEEGEGAMLIININYQPLHCNLEMPYEAFLNAPERLDAVIAAHLAALPHVPAPLTEKEASQSLIPLLQQLKWLKQVLRREATPPAQRPFAGDLFITYAFDFPTHRTYLNEELMAKMTGSGTIIADSLHNEALQNLRMQMSSEDYEMHGFADGTFITCNTQDGYASSRVLLPELMQKWDKRIPGRMLLGIPNRDFLIAFSDRNPQQNNFIRQIRLDARKQDNALSPNLFVWQDNRVQLFQPKH